MNKTFYVPVDNRMDCSEQGRPGLVVKADDDTRAGKVAQEAVWSFTPVEQEIKLL